MSRGTRALVGLGVALLSTPAAAGNGNGNGNVIAAHACQPSAAVKASGIPSKFDDDGNAMLGPAVFADLDHSLGLRSTLDFQVLLSDTAGGWDPNTQSYTIPETGLYKVTYKSELVHDPRHSTCLHIWLESDTRWPTADHPSTLETLFAINAADQAPKYRPYDGEPNGEKIAFKPYIDTEFYLYEGDVLYPMWIQFAPKNTVEADDKPASLTGPYCENHFFKIHKVSE